MLSLALLLIAPDTVVPCASCSDPSAAIVQRGGSIEGVPLYEPAAVELQTGDGLRTLWNGPASLPSGPTHARVSRELALSSVAELGVEGVHEGTARLVWAQTLAGLRLSWIVNPAADLSALRNDLYRVDATTGGVWHLANLVSAASARAYPENPLITPAPEVYELTGLLDPGETLTHPRFDVQSCQDPVGASCTRVRHAVPDEAGDFFFEPQSGLVVDDPFSETSAYVHAERFMDHMQTFGVEGLVCEEMFDTRPIILTNFLIEGEPVENGYYSATCPVSILLGQGEEEDWAYDGDVVYHELGHAIVHRQVPTSIGFGHPRADAWVYDSRAINEAVADALAAAFTGNSIIAESLIPRDIDSDAQCPGDLTGQQHNDSMPVSAALWSLYLTWGDDFEPVLLDALATLPSDVDYDTFAEAMAAVAFEVLGADAATEATAAFEATGVIDCERVVPLHPDASLQWVFLDAQLGLNPLTPPPLQFSVEVDAQTERVEFDYRINDIGVLAGPVHMSWRWDAPVGFEYGGEDGTEVSIMFDDGVTDLEANGTLSFEPPSVDASHQLYVAFSNVADGQHWVGVDEVVFVDAPPVDPGEGTSTGGAGGTGADATGPDTTASAESTGQPPPGTSSSAATDTEGPSASSGGGACHVGGDASWWLLALLPLANLRRRGADGPRRRRRSSR